MRNPFRRKALTGTPDVVAALRGGFNTLPQLGSAQQQRIERVYNTARSANYAWMYEHSPAVRTVIDTIARNIGQLDLRLYEEVTESELRPRPDHPAALSLRYPSETVPADQFVRQLFKDFLIADDAVAVMAPGSSGRIVFKWVPVHWVEFLSSNVFETEVYRIHNLQRGTFADYPEANVLHWRGENPSDPRVGFSHLETLRDVVAEDAALQQAIVELAKSGLAEPSWVYRPLEAPEWSNNARKGFEEDLTNRVKRVNKTPVVLEEGMELRSFGVSPRDAQMLDVRKWAITRIATEYGLPLGMVGLDPDVKSAQSIFYSDTLPPYCESFTKMLNQRILVRVYDWTQGCFEFNLDEKLMGDERLKTLVSATGRPVMLTDEARAKLNLPPVDGGDELVTPLNVIVGENPKPSPQIMPPQDPNKPPQDGSYRQEPPKALDPSPVPAHVADMARQRRAIDKATAVFVRHYTRQYSALKSMKSKAADTEKWNEKLSSSLEDVVRQIIELEGTAYVSRLGGVDFDLRQLENYIKAMAEGVAEGVNAATQQDIEDVGVDDAFKRARSQRAEVAGASVGTRATVQARYEAARQSPNPHQRVKTWIADTDRHADLGGETVPLGEGFSQGFEPGGPANCRCSLVIS